MVTFVTNHKIWSIVIVLGLVLGCGITGIVGGRFTAPTTECVDCAEQPVVEKTIEVTPTPAPEVTEEAEAPVTEPVACQGWSTGETRDLLPGQRALGDIVARHLGWDEAMKAYDEGGSGQGTIVANNTNQPIEIYAEWGAGCLLGDTTAMVNGEFEHGCGDSDNGCDQVRLVILTNHGVSVEFYDSPLP